MALKIRNKEAEQLADELARLTSTTRTAAVTAALRDQLARIRRERDATSLADRLVATGRECAALPVLDERDDDEILGYDERGLPG